MLGSCVMLTGFWGSLAISMDRGHCLATFKNPQALGPRTRLTELYFEIVVTLLDGQIQAHGKTACQFTGEHIINTAGNVLQC